MSPLWGSSLFRVVEASPTMSALPVELAFEFSKFLRPGELFRIYMASPAISNNLGASIVIARQQRRERMEYCDDYIRIHEEKLLLYAMEELRIEAWGEPWNDGPPTGHRLLDGGQWSIQGYSRLRVGSPA